MGETVKLSHRKDGERLVQTFTSVDGTPTNVFVPGPDGKSFTMQVTITSPRSRTSRPAPRHRSRSGATQRARGRSKTSPPGSPRR